MSSFGSSFETWGVSLNGEACVSDVGVACSAAFIRLKCASKASRSVSSFISEGRGGSFERSMSEGMFKFSKAAASSGVEGSGAWVEVGVSLGRAA